MTAAFETLKAMGVFMAVIAGNEGPGCSTINAPPAVEMNALVVCAVDHKDRLAPFSSRGPVTVIKGRVYRKPDLVAPGVDVQGPILGDTFRGNYGTSMAAPHVGGGALLVMALCPDYERDVEGIVELLTSTAVPLLPITRSLCGKDTPHSIPNNHYGYGRLDLWAAIRKCRDEG
jgi:subtilase family protein